MLVFAPFDREMRRRGYQLTRYADDWVVTCRSRREGRGGTAVRGKAPRDPGRADQFAENAGYVRHGFAFLGTIKRGGRALYLPRRSSRGARRGLYAYPTQRSVDQFKDAIRRKTRRRIPLSTAGLIRELNPVIRGWGEKYWPGSRAEAQPARPVGGSTAVVPSVQAVALHRVEDAPDAAAPWRVGAGGSCFADSDLAPACVAATS